MSRWLFLGMGLAALIAAWTHVDPTGLTGLDAEQLAAATVVLAIIAMALTALSVYRHALGRAMRDVAVWLFLLLGVAAGYSFRHDLTAFAYRFAGELAPPGQGVTLDNGEAGEKAVRIRRRADGHFVARAEVNGSRLTMLVDTGATTVVLKPADAQLAGIDVKSLSFSVPVQTANGTTYAAPVRLRGIAIGAIAISNVEALVAKPGTLKESLLGISFLRRLRSYEFSGDFLTLRI